MSSPVPSARSAREIAESLRSGAETLDELVGACRADIESREPEIGAWQALDWAAVDAQVRALEDSGQSPGPLWGVPIGVKDLYDTFDFPTECGTEIYAGRRTPWDAAAVARLRSAGAIVIGKTVTTELAYWKPGRTRNPRRAGHTPGGSSSGSAAAVADGMVPAALGSQTAASIVRPAAYCGIVGFKPTAGIISLAGVKPFAASLDTAGALAGSVADVALVTSVMAARPDWLVAERGSAPRIAIVRSAEWDLVHPEALKAFHEAIETLAEAGAVVTERQAAEPFDRLAEAQAVVMAVEASRDYAFESRAHWERLSPQLQDLLTEGERTPVERYEEAMAMRASALGRIGELLAGADVLAAPSATGEAPLLEEGTGDPAMSRGWTFLGLPSISIPFGRGPLGLPLGLQLAAPPRSDGALLAAAGWAEAVFGR